MNLKGFDFQMGSWDGWTLSSGICFLLHTVTIENTLSHRGLLPPKP